MTVQVISAQPRRSVRSTGVGIKLFVQPGTHPVQHPRDGLVYTGLAAAGGVEDAMYQYQGRASGTVGGKPAVASSVLGGNGTLAWEPIPGLVCYVGYSGAAMDDAAVAALHRLAERTGLLDWYTWRATNPTVVDQDNTPTRESIRMPPARRNHGPGRPVTHAGIVGYGGGMGCFAAMHIRAAA